MLIERTHIAGPVDGHTQRCSRCGVVLQLSSLGAWFGLGERVGLIVAADAVVFTPYLTGANDTNRPCWEE